VNPSDEFPKYDIHKSYHWNYDNAPAPVEMNVPAIDGAWSFCGLDVDSPLGVPAGPLLNGKWILYYASLGFDLLTYKTVRSKARACYPWPNLVPVQSEQLTGSETQLPSVDQMKDSWAVSFGMPSAEPDDWRPDIERTRNALPKGKLLSVSVVGTVQEGWSIDDLAADYALCAKWAAESGADAVETNFSCPNVSTCDGQLYRDIEAAKTVATRVRDSIGQTPYLIKIGYMTETEQIDALLDAVGPYIDGIAMTNSVATTVVGPDGKELFEGDKRGICGAATRTASLKQMRQFAQRVEQKRLNVNLIGVGGIGSADDVAAQLAAGAQAVQIATAAMIRPSIACEIREDFARYDSQQR